MSSSDPNLQNIPSSESYGREIKKGFVATAGHVFITADYSQIELRILAILSDDANLKNIFITGKDVHTSVASEMFKVTESEVTKDMRRAAKVINFGIIYGMGINALRQNLGSSREDAQKFYDNYFTTFPTIRQYFDDVIALAYGKGYTETMFGRRRYFAGLRSKLPFIRAQAERGAMNAPIQGTEADIVKIATINIEKSLIEHNLINQCHFILQIHDELIYEVEVDKVDKVKKIIKNEMEKVLDNEVKIETELAQGESLGQLQDLK